MALVKSQCVYHVNGSKVNVLPLLRVLPADLQQGQSLNFSRSSHTDAEVRLAHSVLLDISRSRRDEHRAIVVSSSRDPVGDRANRKAKMSDYGGGDDDMGEEYGVGE